MPVFVEVYHDVELYVRSLYFPSVEVLKAVIVHDNFSLFQKENAPSNGNDDDERPDVFIVET